MAGRATFRHTSQHFVTERFPRGAVLGVDEGQSMCREWSLRPGFAISLEMRAIGDDIRARAVHHGFTSSSRLFDDLNSGTNGFKSLYSNGAAGVMNAVMGRVTNS